MKILFFSVMTSCLLAGCASKSSTDHSFGPYYYMSAPPKEGYEPPGDLTRKEAEEIAARGYPYYVTYFDSKGKPDKILKVSGGETEVLQE
jgi:hypothetical protein